MKTKIDWVRVQYGSHHRDQRLDC